MCSVYQGNIYFFDTPKVSISPNSIELAYLNILEDNLAEAFKLFKLNDSPRASWGMVLVSILNGCMEQYPTYFQIRNFYEIDLDFLIKNEKIEYVESLLGALEILININHEVYKYAARVMYSNKLYTIAYDYMKKSKAINYHDAELHFMLAKYYLDNNNSEDAFCSIKECLNLIPDYYPALSLKHEIEQNYV